MADKKVSDLTSLATADGEDLLLIVSDPVGAPASRKITVSDFFSNVSVVTTHTANVVFESSVSFTNGLTLPDTTPVDRLNANTVVADDVIVNGTLTSNGTMTASAMTVSQSTVTGSSTVSGNATFSASLISTGATTITNLTVSNDTVILRDKYGDPTSANAANEGVTAGSIFFSDEFLYIAVDENTLKRVALSSFTI